jgi:hypothetical protein
MKAQNKARFHDSLPVLPLGAACAFTAHKTFRSSLRRLPTNNRFSYGFATVLRPIRIIRIDAAMVKLPTFGCRVTTPSLRSAALVDLKSNIQTTDAYPLIFHASAGESQSGERQAVKFFDRRGGNTAIVVVRAVLCDRSRRGRDPISCGRRYRRSARCRPPPDRAPSGFR